MASEECLCNARDLRVRGGVEGCRTEVQMKLRAEENEVDSPVAFPTKWCHTSFRQANGSGGLDPMKQKKDVKQGTSTLMVLKTLYRLTRVGHRLLDAEKRNWEQTAAIIARFFYVRAEDLT
jgi:hypothetical protein